MAQINSKPLKITAILLGIFLGTFTLAGAVSTFITGQGGTGTTTPSGILYGDNGSTTHLNTVTIGNNLTFSGGTLSASVTGGSGNVATSTAETAGNIPYWTSTSATPATLGKVATSTIAFSGPFTSSGTLGTLVGGTNYTLTLPVANGSTNGYLSSTDWTTFNSKQATISATWPITLSGATVSWGGLATSSAISAASGLLYATGVNTFASIATSSAVNMSVTGNAGTATALQTARAINGVNFDGTAAITITAASSTLLANANTFSGANTFSSLITGSISGNAATVTTNANLSGVITSSGNTTSFGSQSAGVLGNAATGNTAPMATSTLYGNPGAGAYGSMLSWDGSKLAFMATTTTFSGTTGQFPYFSATNTLTATSSLFQAASGNVGIGSTTPNYLLSVGSFGSQFAVNSSGTIMAAASQPATSTAITLDWSATPNQVEYQIGTAATTITIINATTAPMWGSRKLIPVCNPNATAGALTWIGVEWIGTAPTQTTAAGQCDVYSLAITRATSTTAYKVMGSGGTGFK